MGQKSNEWEQQLKDPHGIDREFIVVSHSLGSYLVFSTLNMGQHESVLQDAPCTFVEDWRGNGGRRRPIHPGAHVAGVFLCQSDSLTGVGQHSQDPRPDWGSCRGLMPGQALGVMTNLMTKWRSLRENFAKRSTGSEQAVAKPAQVIAWSDPSDLLSWHLPAMEGLVITNLYVRNTWMALDHRQPRRRPRAIMPPTRKCSESCSVPRGLLPKVKPFNNASTRLGLTVVRKVLIINLPHPGQTIVNSREVVMAATPQALGVYWFIVSLTVAPMIMAQEGAMQTMRPVIRGRQAAVSSMKAEATEAARRILAEGGNAFDAIVGGQAALAVTDFPLNGVGSDAVVLVYAAREKKVVSINAEPRAPKLATIDWYEKNNGGVNPGQRRLALRRHPRGRRRLVHPAGPLGHDELRPGAPAGH